MSGPQLHRKFCDFAKNEGISVPQDLSRRRAEAGSAGVPDMDVGAEAYRDRKLLH